MIYFKDRAFCASKVEEHTCGREFTKQDEIDAEKWWGGKDYPVAYGEFCDSLPIEKKIILDLAGGTGAWAKPYKDAGYDVRTITLPQDLRLYNPTEEVYGILAAPPCTVFSLAGNWVKRSDDEMREALSVVDACLRIIYKCKPHFWALENPVGKLKQWLGEPTMRFDPWQYGDGTFKKTALWGDFNKPVQTVFDKPDRIPYSQTPIGRLGGKSARTKELRSITPAGFAEAFYKANK